MATPVGERLKAARMRAGLSQKELAARTGINHRHISSIEKGDTPDPRLSSLCKLAHALDISVGMFCPDTTPDKAA
jgi:transcriptional regulator with XRE-family HTH domain